MKRRDGLVALVFMAETLVAQQYSLRDGTSLSADEVVVRGVHLVEEVELEGDGSVVERSYPIADVVRLDWPEPDALETARAALATGRAAEAIAWLEPVRSEFVLFAKVPGSWWTASSLLRLRSLLVAGEPAETEEAARELIATAVDPEAVGLARLALAELEAAAGHADVSAAMVDAITAEDVPPGVQARAWVLRGDLALRRGETEAALEAYLRIVVFHGSRRDLLPPALAGSVRAYRLRDDPVRADRTATELIREFPQSPEAALVQSETPTQSPSS